MGVAYNPKIVTNGLVLALDAANRKSYPGSGTTWFDLSGKNNHATLYNAPTYSNNRMLFNGIDEYAQIPFDSVNFTWTLEQTIVLVLSPTENDGNRRNPYNHSYAGSGTWTHEPNGTINFFYGQSSNGLDGTPYTAITSDTVLLNETAMMTSTRSVSTNFRRWYKNGVVTYAENNAVYNPVSVNTSAAITIGNGYVGFYQGYIDMILLYNIALTPDQVKQNFNAIRGRYGI
jgi:hypothetical protein